jgi:DNA modification methylase
MNIERIAIADLSFDPANARKHGDRNLASITASLRRFGQQTPIVIDKSNVVRKGNGTLQAAIAMGWDLIDCIRTELTSSDAIAYAIADNRTSELAEWDDDVLAAQLNGLLADDLDLLDAAGFDEDELAELLGDLDDDEPGEITEDEAPEPPVDPITKPGDLWTLGRHRLLCGDSTKTDDVSRLMDGSKADLCFTSPPYGQQRDYTKEGKEKCQDWDGLMQGVFANLPMSDAGQVLVNLGLIHREGEWIPYWDGWIEWMRSMGWRRFGWYVWDKGHPMPGSSNGRLLGQHEFIWHFCKQPKDPQPTVKKNGDGKRNTWFGARKKDGSHDTVSKEIDAGGYRVAGSVVCVYPEEDRQKDSTHPAVFPVRLAGEFLSMWQGDVYEPFCGSGSTLIAAEQLNRTCYGMEISPQYCDVIVNRWENLTGEKAVCQSKKPE